MTYILNPAQRRREAAHLRSLSKAERRVAWAGYDFLASRTRKDETSPTRMKVPLSASPASEPKEPQTSRVLKNPSRAELLALTQECEWFRALRNPATGDIYAWPCNDALHAEMVQRLGLDFKTMPELKRNSFLFWRQQVEDAPEARDLDELVRIVEAGEA